MAEALSVVKFGRKGVKSKELKEREGGREREREKKRERSWRRGRGMGRSEVICDSKSWGGVESLTLTDGDNRPKTNGKKMDTAKRTLTISVKEGNTREGREAMLS